jgi:hypothetical protein
MVSEAADSTSRGFRGVHGTIEPSAHSISPRVVTATSFQQGTVRGAASASGDRTKQSADAR